MAKKVLIITYYWAPSGGAGVHRWLKFVKFLRDFGWEPIIYTPSNPEVSANDDSLCKDVPKNLTILKTNVWEPYNLYKKFIGVKKDVKVNAGFLSETKKPKLTEKIAVWLRGNFFIPDARMFWIKPSIKFLKKYLSENKIDVIVSSGPPHSLHRIALKIHKHTKIPWLADFRDPWTSIDFYDQLMLTSIADKIHHKMEKEVLTTATKVVTVSDNCAKDMKKLCNREIDIITNGYDEQDFINDKNIKPDIFRLSHIGAINKDRNPIVLWQSLAELVVENQEFAKNLQIELVGKVDISVTENIKKAGLENFTKKISYLSHNEAVEHEFSAAVLLLLINNTPNSNGIAPGKLFEYLATQRPILCIGPEDGDSAKIINECNAGQVVNFDDKQKMKQVLCELFNNFKKGNFTNLNSKTNKYSRLNLTNKLANLLDEISTC